MEAVASAVLTKPGQLSAATLQAQLPRWLAYLPRRARQDDLLGKVLSDIGSRKHSSWGFRPVGRPHRAIGHAIKMSRHAARDIIEMRALGADPVVSVRTLRRYKKKGLLPQDSELDAKPADRRDRRRGDQNSGDDRDLGQGENDEEEGDEQEPSLSSRDAILLAVRRQQAEKQKHSAAGFSLRQAAEKLGLAESTVRFFRDKAEITKGRRLTSDDLAAIAALARKKVRRKK